MVPATQAVRRPLPTKPANPGSSTQISESALLTQGGSGVAELISGGKTSSFSRNISCNFILMPNREKQLRNVRTARTTAADDGNVVGLGDRRRVAVDNFVGGIEQERWVGKGQGVERRKDGVCGISEVVLCCWGEMSILGQLL